MTLLLGTAVLVFCFDESLGGVFGDTLRAAQEMGPDTGTVCPKYSSFHHKNIFKCYQGRMGAGHI